VGDPLAASLIRPAVTGAQTASPPLILEAKIPLGQMSGRIDHLGIDAKRPRLLDRGYSSQSTSRGFQIDEAGNRVFVNVPDAHEIGVVDLAAGSALSLPMQGAGSNFPMAIDGDGSSSSFATRRS
jgi:hypothetical protein